MQPAITDEYQYALLNTQHDDNDVDETATATSHVARTTVIAHHGDEAEVGSSADETARLLVRHSPYPVDDQCSSLNASKAELLWQDASVSVDVLDCDELRSCIDWSAISSLLSTTPFRVLLLLLLAWQTSVHTLLVRYSRGILHERYSATSALLCAEALKLLVSCALIGHAQSLSVTDTVQRMTHNVYHSLPMAVPALLFVAQSKLNLIALHYLDSSSYSILLQLKLLTTAVFAQLMLKKQLQTYQWRGPAAAVCRRGRRADQDGLICALHCYLYSYSPIHCRMRRVDMELAVLGVAVRRAAGHCGCSGAGHSVGSVWCLL